MTRPPSPPPELAPWQLSADGRPLPTWRDGSLCALLCIALALQLLAWWGLAGYELADSIEYMERALLAVEGNPLGGTSSVRSFAFSLVFYPAFKLARALGMEDLRPLVWIGRGLQLFFTLALVLTTVRIGARLDGRRAGWVAGALVAFNPLVLRYGVSPVAEVAAGLCLALGFERLLWRTTVRRSFAGGVWLGLAFLCAYKSLLPIGALALAILVRDRLRSKNAYVGMTVGVAAAVLLQVVLDRFVYGEWGTSLVGWYHGNVSTRIATLLWPIHTHTSGRLSEAVRDLALWFYGFAQRHAGGEIDVARLTEVHMRQPPHWYLANLTEMLVWPVLALVALGALRILLRPRWTALTVLFVVFLFAYITSTKGDKSFRLWLPIAPHLCLIGALGWSWLHGGAGAAAPRRAAAWLCVLAALPLGWRAYRASNPRYFGAFWSAMDFVNAAAAAPAEDSARPARVGASFHWAVFLRGAPWVDVAKCPYPLETWPRANPDRSDLDAEERRAAIREYLASLDWLIAHSAVVTAQPNLLEVVNGLFDVAAVFYDHAEHAGLGPVFALRRRAAGAEPGRSFFQVREGAAAERALDSLAHREPSTFVRTLESGRSERLALLGFELEPVPGTPGLYWLTYHWSTPTGLENIYLFVDRVTAPDARGTFENNHWPGYGALLTPSWKPGALVSESYVFAPFDDPFKAGEEHLPLGGAYRRGDLLPLSLWVGVVRDDEGQWVAALHAEGGVEPFLAPPRKDAWVELMTRLDFGAPLASALEQVAAEFGLAGDDVAVLRERALTQRARWLASGALLSKDGLAEVGRLFLPVEPRAKLADDGRHVIE